MGQFYVNTFLYGEDPRSVVRVLRRLRRRAYVSPALNGFTVIYDQEFDIQNHDAICALAREITSRLSCSALTVLDHDDDVFLLWLHREGLLIGTQKMERPEGLMGSGFALSPMEDFARKLADMFHAQGRVADILSAFETGNASIEELEAAVDSMDMESFARLMAPDIELLKVLECPIEIVGLRYRYLPEDLPDWQARGFVHIDAKPVVALPKGPQFPRTWSIEEDRIHNVYGVSLRLRGPRPATVIRTLREMEREAFVKEMTRHETIIYDRECDSQDITVIEDFGCRLTRRFSCVGLSIMIANDDALVAWVHSDGDVQARYLWTWPPAGICVDIQASPVERFAQEACEAFVRPENMALLVDGLLLYEEASTRTREGEGSAESIEDLSRPTATMVESELAEHLGIRYPALALGYYFLDSSEYSEARLSKKGLLRM